MNIQSHPQMTTDQFLRWNEGREGKREFVRGKIHETMTGGTELHAELMLHVAIELTRTLGTLSYSITASDFAVRTARGVRYPDVLVASRSENRKSLATNDPLLIVEILSPSSLAIDFGEKAEEYTAIDSLRHYLVLSQDEPRAWLWSRDDDGVFQRPNMSEGTDAQLALTGFDLMLPLADLYRGIA